jgi:hypothetical protein
LFLNNTISLDFEFKALQGDPDHWTSIYRLVTRSIFDPLSFVCNTLESLLTYVYPKKRKGADAVVKLNAKFDRLIDKKREELQNGIFSNKPDNEKDLVTLMLEEDILITNEELRVMYIIFNAIKRTLLILVFICTASYGTFIFGR